MINYPSISQNTLESLLHHFGLKPSMTEGKMGAAVAAKPTLQEMREMAIPAREDIEPKAIDASPDLPGDIKHQPEDDGGDWLVRAARRRVSDNPFAARVPTYDDILAGKATAAAWRNRQARKLKAGKG